MSKVTAVLLRTTPRRQSGSDRGSDADLSASPEIWDHKTIQLRMNNALQLLRIFQQTIVTTQNLVRTKKQKR